MRRRRAAAGDRAAGDRPRRGRLLDWPLLACLLAVAAQLIPLAGGAARPALAARVRRRSRRRARRRAGDPRRRTPLSVDVESTGWALALGAAYIGIFWCARAVFSSGGVRATMRGVAWLGLALTALVAVQRATSPSLLYWTWQPISAGASPYGPFVNRNGLASWLAMAVPLVIGYAMARHQTRSRTRRPAIPGTSIDSTQLWLGGAAVLMTGGLLASMSRAGILGGGVGLLAFIVFSRKRIGGGSGVAWMIAGLVAMVVVASAYANLGALAMRLQETTEQGPWGRPAIWRDTWRMASDFWLTGVGAGAFQRGMLVYQEGLAPVLLQPRARRISADARRRRAAGRGAGGGRAARGDRADGQSAARRSHADVLGPRRRRLRRRRGRGSERLGHRPADAGQRRALRRHRRDRAARAAVRVGARDQARPC